MNPMDEAFMQIALDEAEAARKEGNLPFGAVVAPTGRKLAWLSLNDQF